MQTLRGQTEREHALSTSRTLHPGVLIVVQRFRRDLGLYVHRRALVTDGCFEGPDEKAPDDDAQEVRFWPTEQLAGDHLLRTLQRLHAELAEQVLDEGEPPEDGIAACVQLGLGGVGSGPGRSRSCALRAVEPMFVSAFGMQLHAAVTVDGRDRNRLERVCRYLLRPPFARDAVQRTADGQVRIHFKKPSRSGATYAQMTPERFLARLCALVPPPGAHTVRYYGVLAPRNALRARIIPTAEVQRTEPKPLSLFVLQGQIERAAITKPALKQQLLGAAPHRLSWMSLLARVFRVDVSVCLRCRGPMRVLRAVTCPDEVAAALQAARPPPRPAPPGQLPLFVP